MKDTILLENYYFPEDLVKRIGEFVIHCNTRRYHESLNNLPPEDVWLGRGNAMLEYRQRIKEKTLLLRKQLHDNSKAA